MSAAPATSRADVLDQWTWTTYADGSVYVVREPSAGDTPSEVMRVVATGDFWFVDIRLRNQWARTVYVSREAAVKELGRRCFRGSALEFAGA